jgi:hypothetical protein
MRDTYRLLSKRPQSRYTVLTPRETTAFTGLRRSLMRRDIFGSAISLAGVLCAFLPILLSNIPFRLTLTWTTHRICAWLSVSILSLMVLVLAGSVFVKYPYMPVEPNSILGCMYYICDSNMLEGLEGTSTMSEKQLGQAFATTAERYSFGEMTGVSGVTRIGVDYAKDTLQHTAA